MKRLDKITYDALGETVYAQKLPNGLQVYLLPKASVFKTYGIFMTNYGSIDRSFAPIGQKEAITVPDGIAHFLEHKLFEKEDRDVSDDFLNQGASPNAYTSFTKTAYLFSTTKMETENIVTLLDFVQDPFFSEESVEKEKGIITQEIKMYDDQADWQSYMGTIKNMFVHHPVNIDIAGTVSSIQTITKDDLYTCYHTFYHPSNMVLFVTGNFRAEEMMDTIKQNQASKTFPTPQKITRIFPEESKQVATKASTIHLPVSIPKVTVGIKESTDTLNEEAFFRADLLQELLLDYFFSVGGIFYEQLYDKQLIDESFEYSTTVEKHFSYSIIGSNTHEPEQLADTLTQLLLETKTMELTEETLSTMKKKKIGQLLRSMNSLEAIANQYVHYYFAGIDFFTYIDHVQSLTLKEANAFLKEWITEEQLTVCTIETNER